MQRDEGAQLLAAYPPSFAATSKLLGEQTKLLDRVLGAALLGDVAAQLKEKNGELKALQ